jgi:hypothetical protein
LVSTRGATSGYRKGGVRIERSPFLEVRQQPLESFRRAFIGKLFIGVGGGCSAGGKFIFDGYPVLDSGFRSSIPGLHFIGARAARTFGPLLYFVAGTEYSSGC